MRDIELYPKSDKTSLFTRGVLDLGSGHQFFAEASLARASTFTPARQPDDVDMDVSKIPALAPCSPACPQRREPDHHGAPRLTEAGCAPASWCPPASAM
jgi:hypothetical protein